MATFTDTCLDAMSPLETDAAHYNRLRKRVRSLLDESPEHFAVLVDPGMDGILRDFNAVPGVVTRYSCASHPEKERSLFYIQFFANLEGIVALMAIYNALRVAILERKYDVCDLELAFRQVADYRPGQRPKYCNSVCISTMVFVPPKVHDGVEFPATTRTSRRISKVVLLSLLTDVIHTYLQTRSAS